VAPVFTFLWTPPPHHQILAFESKKGKIEENNLKLLKI